MKQFSLFLILLSTSFIVKSQENTLHCGTDEITHQLFQQHPELQAGMIHATEKLEQFTQNYIAQPNPSRSNATYTIPVVFHIIHDYGIGNISDEQVFDAIKQVNMQYRKQNADTIAIVNEFKGMGVDTEIEFRLAKLDPDGNCTNGITRTYSPLTNTGGHVVKDLIHWPSDQYLNVYVCNYVGAGLAGHCLLPGTADTIPEWDGIVIQHGSIGSIGTSSPLTKTVLTHEIGHYLNLQHIWGGNNVPGFYYLPVGDPGNCSQDDGVADTPNTIGWSSCNLSGSTCDATLDMVQNYMDYSYCSVMFTEGQKQRMHAALNSTVAHRNNLWSNTNLIATGVIGADNLCQASIKVSDRVVCMGESVDFSDLSYHGVTSRNWTFQGGDMSTSTDSAVTVIYNTPGKYDVQLSISNGSQTIDTLLIDYIQVLPVTSIDNKIVENFENESVFNDQWYIIPNANPTQFERVNTGKNSAYSISIDNFNGAPNGEYAFQSMPIDASQFSEFAVTLDYAYAKMSTTNQESIFIEFSKDCGLNWSIRKKISINNDYSVASDDEFFPTEDSLWIHKEYTLPIGGFNVDDLRVRFLFNGYGGNNLFIDNINISDISELSLSPEVGNIPLRIYPNPANTTLKVEIIGGELDGNIQLYDVYGKSIYTSEVKGKQQVIIHSNAFAEGTYFLHYLPNDSKDNTTIRKVIVVK